MKWKHHLSNGIVFQPSSFNQLCLNDNDDDVVVGKNLIIGLSYIYVIYVKWPWFFVSNDFVWFLIIIVGDDDNHEVDGEQGVIGLPLLLIPII